MDVAGRAESLLKSLKGVRDARVYAGVGGRITRVEVECDASEQREVQRNVKSALMAMLGVRLEPGMLFFDVAQKPPVRLVEIEPEPAPAVPGPEREDEAPAPVQERGAQVLEIAATGRRADLNEAARAAFDTLRNAQSIFHGFVFDGAELVTINGNQYIVVAVRRAATDARYCGAAPVVTAIGTASARALMNAVGMAAMGSPSLEFEGDELARPEKKQA